MDLLLQALVMGVVQGLTEFLPVSSSGHLIIVPFLAGWDDTFINSLAFSVMLHLGTLVALLSYFRGDWLRLVPAGLAAIRERSLAGDPDRVLAWVLVAATIPAALVGFAAGDLIEDALRQPGLVAAMLIVGAAILFLADRIGATSRSLEDVTFPVAIGIGVAQALALLPGISRSGISISAGRLVGLDRQSAARFAFLMATPITGLAVTFEAVQLVTGPEVVGRSTIGPLAVGMVASLVSGVVAIRFMLDFLRRQSLDAFVVYRLLLAGVVLAVVLTR